MAFEVKDTEPGHVPTEWNDRTLCSDENCIGVIGPDGRCKECGKPYAGGPAVDLPRPEPAPAADTAGLPPDPVDPAGSDEEWERRTLCSDENCIGVIGPDGRCKECGKAHAK